MEQLIRPEGRPCKQKADQGASDPIGTCDYRIVAVGRAQHTLAKAAAALRRAARMLRQHRPGADRPRDDSVGSAALKVGVSWLACHSPRALVTSAQMAAVWSRASKTC